MAKTAATNYSGSTYDIPGAGSDAFLRTDVSGPGTALNLHTHASGLGLAVTRIQNGNFADRPAAGNAGHVYFANDTGALYFDNGAAWVQIPGAASVTSAMIVDGTIVAGDLASDAVTTVKILDANVTTAKLAANILSADATGLGKMQDGFLTADATGRAKMANDFVNIDKIGNQVVGLLARQGGSATDWSTQGTNNYTPTTARLQVGVSALGNGTTSVAITFPVAFSDKPSVTTQREGPGYSAPSSGTITSSGFLLIGEDSTGAQSIHWWAIGPE